MFFFLYYSILYDLQDNRVKFSYIFKFYRQTGKSGSQSLINQRRQILLRKHFISNFQQLLRRQRLYTLKH